MKGGAGMKARREWKLVILGGLLLLILAGRGGAHELTPREWFKIGACLVACVFIIVKWLRKMLQKKPAQCTHCGKEIPAGEKTCPHCGNLR